MPDPGYQSHLSFEAVAFVVTLPKRQQKRVLDLADQIARHPFGISDYVSVDAEGRRIENLLLGAYHFSYWVDHAAREIRITDVTRV